MDYNQATELKNSILHDFVFLPKEIHKTYNSIDDRSNYQYDSLKTDLFQFVNGVAIIKEFGSYALKIYVEGNVSKKSLSNYFGLRQSDFILDNIGPITILSYPQHGDYICYPNGAIGTLGCHVKDSTGRVFVLSNNHVLSNYFKGKVGDPTLHPGVINTGNNVIGHVTKLHPVLFNNQNNELDCGIAELLNQERATKHIPGIGNVGGTVSAVEGMNVRKRGYKTGLTNGEITSTEANIKVDYGGRFFSKRVANFYNQIEIKGRPSTPIFSNVGDSGSLLVDNQINTKAVGLIFAGAPDGTTFANPINKVLSALLVDIL